MEYDDASFRAMFPEFSDTIKYPAVMIEQYFDLATIFISSDGSPCTGLSGKTLRAALNYMTAHLMVLSLQQSAAGSATSNQGGFETSASIGEISVSKLAPPAKDAWQYWLYQTPYGQALMALLGALAAGGLSVGGLPEREAFRKVGGVFF